jgi:hypothetical protein
MGTNSKVWMIATVVSVLLLVLVFINIDITVLVGALSRVRTELLLPAIGLLAAEAMVTAKRIQYFTNSNANYSQGLYANAWYVMWLNILPARLGEVAAMSVFQRVFGMSSGGAIASIVTQRLFDLLVLTILLIGVLSVNFLNSSMSWFINVSLAIFVLAVIATFGKWLDLICRCLYQIKQRHKLLRRLLFICLQARGWYKRDFSQLKVWYIVAQTFAKWAVCIIGIAMLLAATQVGLATDQLLLIAILTNFLGAVPLQSVGGFGVMEAGLSGILYSFGIALPEAIAVSLFLRVSILAFVLAYFVLTVLLLRGKIASHG